MRRVPSRRIPNEPVGGHFWTEDSRFVLYSQDKGGDEDYHVYAVDPDVGRGGGNGRPASA